MGLHELLCVSLLTTYIISLFISGGLWVNWQIAYNKNFYAEDERHLFFKVLLVSNIIGAILFIHFFIFVVK